MKFSSIILLTLLICSMSIFGNCQIETNKKCQGGSCASVCRRVIGVAAGKCINGRCVCYP
uniref:Potassium channel toxin alpha-KTx 15.4 n=1 Tax=Androctonus australis TaxID=6858 RepID=KA154_ANDAU